MAILAKNTIFKVATVAVTGITAIAWAGTTWKMEDTTSNDNSTPVTSTQTTIRTEGKFSLTILWDPTSTEHQALRTLSQSGASGAFVVVYVNTGETQTFNGYVTGFVPDVSVSGLDKRKVEITPAGAITLS